MDISNTLDIKTIVPLIVMAIAEDRGSGDVTSELLFKGSVNARARIVAREDLIVCGMDLVHEVLCQYDDQLKLEILTRDGQFVPKQAVMAVIEGPLTSILSAERVVLNFLQRLCGIATLTGKYVQMVQHTKAKIYDTRKTTPAWRVLEKYAVRCGGAYNHRMGLYDGVLIKDNHLAEFADSIPERLTELVQRASALEQVKFFEVEVDCIDQLVQVLEVSGIDIVLLDNMDESQMREAVLLRDKICKSAQPLLEASGGITLDNLAAAADTGVDRIAVGAITHSAIAVDIGLDR